MCGIIAVFNYTNSYSLVLEGLKTIRYRGKDYYCLCNGNQIIGNKRLKNLKIDETGNCIGHALHSIVSFIPQPFHNKEHTLASNCEIYNWKKIRDRYSLKARNDAETLFLLIQKIGIKKAISRRNIDGPYAICYKKGRDIILARDILGIKPLWYALEKREKNKIRLTFACASEKKALEEMGFTYIYEVHPRTIITFNTGTNQLTKKSRTTFKIQKNNDKKEDIIKKTSGLITAAIAKRVPDRKFGVLFSGGIDSTFIAFILKKLGLEPILFTAALNEPGLKDADDLHAARKAAHYLRLPLKENLVSLDDTEEYIRDVIKHIETTNIVKVGVALPFYLSCKIARKEKCKVLFSGLGSEEIFAGYQRHREVSEKDINKECKRGLLQMYSRDNYRDDIISMMHSIELRHPFMDHDLIRYTLGIPGKYKIKDGQVKVILREIAQKMGLPEEFAMRKKRAAQYGSNFDKAIAKLAKRKKMYKQEYLESFCSSKYNNI
jgi:diphthine-ammonia ligase